MDFWDARQHSLVGTTLQGMTSFHTLTPYRRALLGELNVLQLVKKFPTFHRFWRLTTTLLSCFFNIYFKIILPHMSRSSSLFRKFSHWNPVSFTPLHHTITCATHLILDIIIWIIFGQEQKSQNSIWNFSLLLLLPLRPKYLPQHPTPEHSELSPFIPPSIKFQRGKIIQFNPYIFG